MLNLEVWTSCTSPSGVGYQVFVVLPHAFDWCRQSVILVTTRMGCRNLNFYGCFFWGVWTPWAWHFGWWAKLMERTRNWEVARESCWFGLWKTSLHMWTGKIYRHTCTHTWYIFCIYYVYNLIYRSVEIDIPTCIPNKLRISTEVRLIAVEVPQNEVGQKPAEYIMYTPVN